MIVKGDKRQIEVVCSYLTVTHLIPKKFIKKEYFLLFYQNQVAGMFKHITPSDILQKARIRQPDIVILGDNGIKLIIEIDGTFHYNGAGKEKTKERNNMYRNAGLKFIVINIKDDTKNNCEKMFKILDRAVNEAGLNRRQKMSERTIHRPGMDRMPCNGINGKSSNKHTVKKVLGNKK